MALPNYLSDELEQWNAGGANSIAKPPHLFRNVNVLCSHLDTVTNALTTDYSSVANLLYYLDDLENVIWCDVEVYLGATPFITPEENSEKVRTVLVRTWMTLLKRAIAIMDSFQHGLLFCGYAKRVILTVAALPDSAPNNSFKKLIIDVSLKFINHTQKGILKVVNERSVLLCSYLPPRNTLMMLKELTYLYGDLVWALGVTNCDVDIKTFLNVKKELEFSSGFFIDTYVQKVTRDLVLLDYQSINWKRKNTLFTVNQIHPSIWMFFTLCHMMAVNVNGGPFSKEVAGELIAAIIEDVACGLMTIAAQSINEEEKCEMPVERRTQLFRDILCFTLLSRALRNIIPSRNSEVDAHLIHLIRYANRYLNAPAEENVTPKETSKEEQEDALEHFQLIWNSKTISFFDLLDANKSKVPWGASFPLDNSLFYMCSLPPATALRQVALSFEKTT